MKHWWRSGFWRAANGTVAEAVREELREVAWLFAFTATLSVVGVGLAVGLALILENYGLGL